MSGQAGDAGIVVVAIAAALLMVLAGVAKKQLVWRQRRPFWQPRRWFRRHHRRMNG